MSAQTRPLRPLIAGLLSLINPGLGLFYAGRLRAAVWAAAAAFVLSFGLGLCALAAIWAIGEAPAALAGPGVAIVLHAIVVIPCALLIARAVSGWKSAAVRPPAYPLGYFGFAVFPIIAAIGASTVVRTHIAELYRIPSASMEPTLLRDTLVVGVKVGVRGAAPARGAIIAFHPPGAPEQVYIKRVIGLPGETVAMIDGAPIINDAPIPQRLLGVWRHGAAVVSEESAPNAAAYVVLDETPNGRGDHMAPVVIPDGQVFVLGDNRDRSEDSRSYRVGLVPTSAVIAHIRQPHRTLSDRVR